MSIIFAIGGCSRTASGGQLADRGWPPAAGAGFSRLISHRPLRVTVGLAALGVTAWVNLRTLHPGLSGLGSESLVALVALGAAGVAWLAWMAAAPHGPGGLVALVAMGAAGGVVSSTSPAGLIFVGVAASGAGAVRDLIGAAGVAAVGPFAFAGAAFADGSFPGRLAPACAVCLLGLVSGAGRRQLFERARQATLIALADERAQVASREAALAAERNRLGRELHDVLAHTLGALSVQLSALDALAGNGATPGEFREQLEQAHKLVDEGLDEAHQAVRALREHPRPLIEELARLCHQHAAAFEVSGTPHPVSAEAHLALYRVAQEALTNAARHAPGVPVTVEATFTSSAVTLTVRNPASKRPARAGTGGYGLSGMRERVLLAGGHCHAGPTGQGWQVTASIPA
jgi:signal transduction histidine kinase